MSRGFIAVAGIILLSLASLPLLYPPTWGIWIVVLPILLLGSYDLLQRRKAVLRNWPILGHFRYFFEGIRPEIQQYFIESDTSGTPFSRRQRSLVYQRAKRELDTVPFGTQHDVYRGGYEWVNHSLVPSHISMGDLRINVGGPQCKQPYSASLLNISAMSYGALSKNAVIALNQGAQMGGFAHNTGEGGISPYHLEGGADLIWQIGTGYFGCRTEEGAFSEEAFQEKAAWESVKMIELKLSQGAKPGHGGILPAAKVTPEIAEIRGVPLGKDVLSPPAHSTFSTPIELLQFIAKLRELSGGKPVGFKLCLGKRREFMALCKAMHQTQILPDFISIDGGEGGTGAAPLEFSDFIGTPSMDGLVFIHNALMGFGLRKSIRLIVSAKIASGFSIIKQLALGADLCYSARSMMMALGCIQALRCNSNQCPVGVATQDPSLVSGLVISDKNRRVMNFHENTLQSTREILEAMGLKQHENLRPWHVMRRVNYQQVRHYGELFHYLEEGELLGNDIPPTYQKAFYAATADSFDAAVL